MEVSESEMEWTRNCGAGVTIPSQRPPETARDTNEKRKGEGGRGAGSLATSLISLRIVHLQQANQEREWRMENGDGGVEQHVRSACGCAAVQSPDAFVLLEPGACCGQVGCLLRRSENATPSAYHKS